jgi:dTDP-glucose 4,6-dehydratase
MGVEMLLEAALKHRVTRFVHISTDEVYGSIPDGRFARESDRFEPGSPYAASKAAADLLCLSFCKTHRLPLMITRASNNYGPYQFPEKVIPFFITEALAGQHLPLYGRGANVRNWLHVEDNCRAVLTILDKGAPGEIYNVGGENYLDNLSLTKQILTIMGLPESRIKFVEDRPGHDLRYAVDSSKIRALGWSPKIAFADGLRRTVEWYMENRDWWQDIKIGEHLKFYERHYKNR